MLSLAHVIMSQNLPVQLRVLVPIVENSVSSNSYRPSDVIVTRSGISVEVTIGSKAFWITAWLPCVIDQSKCKGQSYLPVIMLWCAWAEYKH